MIDLHTHSTASDGTLSPVQLVRKAVELNLKALALTDHDTTSGLKEFIEAGENEPVKIIPGVEIAASWYGSSLHIAGLFIDPDCEVLNNMLYKVRQDRDFRNRKILRRLWELGINLTYEDVEHYAGNEVMGRPHFAAALVDQGFCHDHKEAFTDLLGKDASAYVKRYLPLPAQTIDAIHQAGGTAAWAHPLGGIENPKPARIRQTASHLKKLGLDAMEVYYSEYTQEKEDLAKKIADEFYLAWSGGSDFHGNNLPDFQLGVGKGNLCVPDKLLNSLYPKLRYLDPLAR